MTLIVRKLTGLIRKYDPLTLSRIEQIETVPIAKDTCMEDVLRAQNRDLPKEQRPGKCTKYYRFTGGRFVIASFHKQKVINCIVDNKCCHEGKVIPLFPPQK
jgi:hypothetical protein